MLTPSTPAAPLLAATRLQAASKVLGVTTLSIKLYHLPPWTPLTRAANMRSVHTDASTQSQFVGPWVSVPGLAISGTGGTALKGAASMMTSCIQPSYPPSLSAVLLAALFYRLPQTPWEPVCVLGLPPGFPAVPQYRLHRTCFQRYAVL